MIYHLFKVRSFAVAVILTIEFSSVLPSFAQQASFIIDTNSGEWTKLERPGRDMNNAGQVTGTLRDTAESQAFITGPNGVGIMQLGTLGGDRSVAFAINDSGQVVGYSSTATGESHAFITGPNGVGMTDLGKLPGDTFSYASGLNDAGQVVGNSSRITGEGRAFITGPNGLGMTDLGTLPGHGNSFSADVNDAGQVVGMSRAVGESYHVFITGFNGEGMTDLGTFGGYEGFAYDINNAGQIAGVSFGSAQEEQAFITGPNGVGMINLNSLVDLPHGYMLQRALAINDQGQVLVSGVVPEPEAFAMLPTGLALIAYIAGGRKGRRRLSSAKHS